ncbi:MAG: hypothetical protein ACRC06_14570, partial [Waterburya sp.]
FPQAIAVTQSLMEKINLNQLSELKIEKEVSSLVSSKNGARGFFVAYLTSEMSLADHPSIGVINGLKSAITIVSDLLVKNLAMSSAMVITHTRNHDSNNLEGSQTVCRRTSNLIQQLQLKSLTEELEKLQTTIITGQGDYQDFLTKWNYNSEQQQAIQEAIAKTLIK